MLLWKLFAILVPVVFVLDLIWLAGVMKGFYHAEIGDLAHKVNGVFVPRWSAGIFVYVLIPAGIVLFVRPALGKDPGLCQALAWGALFGLVLYGVYDLTNRTILEKWSWRLTLADIAWGCSLCGVTAGIMQQAERLLSR